MSDTTTCVRIGVLSDDRVYGEGLLRVLNTDSSLSAIGMAGGSNLKSALRASKPHSMVIDSQMNGALDLCAELVDDEQWPVVFVRVPHHEAAVHALLMGARGVVYNTEPPQDVLKAVHLCPPLIDTIPTCTARWVQLPPALTAIDQVFQKLNTTIVTAVSLFSIGSAGRFVFVNTYDKLRDHCMKMEVSFKTEAEHPEEDGAVHGHDSPSAVNFGCSEPWFVAGNDGTDIPFYLEPAAIGVLIQESQTTSGMGVYPNDDGQKCISDLIWEADTIDPGVTPLKWKLSIPEAPNSNICQSSS